MEKPEADINFSFVSFYENICKKRKHRCKRKKNNHLTKNEEWKRKQITLYVRCTSIGSIAWNDLHWAEKLNAAFRNRNCVHCHNNDQIYDISYTSSYAGYNMFNMNAYCIYFERERDRESEAMIIIIDFAYVATVKCSSQKCLQLHYIKLPLWVWEIIQHMKAIK